MLLPKFEYHEPSTLEEVCRIMADLKEKAKLLAGGTDLLVKMKKRVVSAEKLVSIGEIRELYKKEHVNGQLVVGAGVKAAELGQSEEMSGEYNALIMAANSLGSPLIRNLATIGGNLVSARPAADLPLPLMAYGARVVLKKLSGERTVPLDNFFRGPGETVIQSDEILTAILIDKPPPYSGSGYIKLGVRKTLEISLVNVAVCISIDSRKGFIKSARVVLGAVAPTPMRAASAEQVLLGEEPHESLFVAAGEAAARDSRPIDDFRGSAGYRRAMVAVLTRRALNMALIKAKEQ